MTNLSRKYRPRIFADIAGQERVTQTLRREVEQSKLGHAYLFSGPRGVGKTTAARIFAKAVNCLDSKGGEPCLKCAACERIANAQAIDFIEIDAASHTGVDNVREAIIEHVRFVPAALKYKVYIVDEAHMLSAQAWNALLKTIEEPPAYAIFIFATTEKHKVPATIVSRCQKFDFMRVSEERIVERLEFIVKDEGLKADKSVLINIASRSEGCLRDAENLLGQLMGLGEKEITEDVASLVLPPSRLPQAAQLLSAAADGDTPKALELIAGFEQDGVALMPLFDDLLLAIRRLTLAAASVSEKQAMSKGDEGQKALSPLVGKFESRELVNLALLFMERRRETKQGLDPRFAMELALVAASEGMAKQHPDVTASSVAPTQPKPPKKDVADIEPPKPPTPPTVDSTPKPTSAASVPPKIEAKDEASESHGAPVCSLDQVLVKWQPFLAALENNKSLLFILKLCKPLSIQGNKLNLRFQYAYHKQTIIGNVKNKQIVENALREALGVESLVIDGVDGHDDGTAGESTAPSTIGRLMDAFGGQVAT